MNRQAQEKETNGKHELHLLGRRNMQLSGVKEVLSFDEESVHLQSECGELFVEGTDIRIGTLDTDHGMLELEGMIDTVYYAAEPQKKKNQLFGRLFG